MEVLQRLKRDVLPKPPSEGRAIYKSNQSPFNIYPVAEESALRGNLIDALSVYSQKTARAGSRTSLQHASVSRRSPTVSTGLLAAAAAATAAAASTPVASGQLRVGGMGPLAVGLDDPARLSVPHAWARLVQQRNAGHCANTDRSSVSSSITVDDFDSEASAKMQRLFDDIDAALFERQDPAGQPMAGNIYQECLHWNVAFPHLRVLGRQLVLPSDVGFEIVAARNSGASTTPIGLATRRAPANPAASVATLTARLPSDHVASAHFGSNRSRLNGGDSIAGIGQRLSVTGTQVVPVSLDQTAGVTSDDVSRLTEEVIAQEGYYEEIIAIDDGHTEPTCRAASHSAHDEPDRVGYSAAAEGHLSRVRSAKCAADQQQQQEQRSASATNRLPMATSATRRSKHTSRYPPVTPSACAKDCVDDAAFGALWPTVLLAMKPLLQRYAQTFALLHIARGEQDIRWSSGAEAAGGPTQSLSAAGRYELLAHRLGVNALDAHRFPAIRSHPNSRAERLGSAAGAGPISYAESVAARLSLNPMSPTSTPSRHRWQSGGSGNGGGGSSSSSTGTHSSILWHGTQLTAASASVAGSATAEDGESRTRLGNILTISKKEMQARDRHGDEMDVSRTSTATPLDQTLAVHQAVGKEGPGISASMSGGSGGHVAAIVAHINALASSSQSRKSASVSTAASTAALSIVAASNRRSRLTPLPDRSLTPYADEATSQHLSGSGHGAIAAGTLQRLHMTGKKIASPLVSASAAVVAAAASVTAPTSVDGRISGGSLLPPIVGQQVADHSAHGQVAAVQDLRTVLPLGIRSPAPPLASGSGQNGASRSTVRRRFADRVGSAVASSSDKTVHHLQRQQMSPTLLSHSTHDKSYVTTGSAAAVTPSAAVGQAPAVSPVAITANGQQRPNTTHGFSGTRVNIQFAGSSSKASFTPIGISPLAKAGSLHNITYRRGGKVLNPFAR